MIALTYDILGTKKDSTTLPKSLFGTKVSPSLLAQAVRVFLSNQRSAKAKVKTRGEIDRTNHKLYKQKGTGGARHGSRSANVFVGGGVIFGPTGEQNYKLNLPTKMKGRAILGALTEKAEDKNVIVISNASKSDGKTKQSAELFSKVGIKGSTLIIASIPQAVFKRACRNLPKTDILQPGNINAYEIIKHKNLLITLEAIEEMEKLYVK